MKSKIFKFFLFLSLIFLPFITIKAVKASNLTSGTAVYIAKNEIVAGNLYSTGKNITVDGTISGDLIATAQNITINGEIDGDLIAIAQNITINGQIGGNVRVAGNNLIINGKVARNLNALESNITLGKNSNIAWDVNLLSESAKIQGTIKGTLSGRVSDALISGKIDKNVDLKINNRRNNSSLELAPETIIKGNFIYSSDNLAKISKQASVLGKIKHTNNQNKNNNWWLLYLQKRILLIFSALVVGLVLIFPGKNITPKILKEIQKYPKKNILAGLILTFILPIVALLLISSIIGGPLALLIIMAWLIAIYLAKILTAILLGQIVIKNFNKKHTASLFWSLVVGVSVCWFLFAIPIFGWIFALLAIWLGLGGLWNYVNNKPQNI